MQRVLGLLIQVQRNIVGSAWVSWRAESNRRKSIHRKLAVSGRRVVRRQLHDALLRWWRCSRLHARQSSALGSVRRIVKRLWNHKVVRSFLSWRMNVIVMSSQQEQAHHTTAHVAHKAVALVGRLQLQMAAASEEARREIFLVQKRREDELHSRIAVLERFQEESARHLVLKEVEATSVFADLMLQNEGGQKRLREQFEAELNSSLVEQHKHLALAHAAALQTQAEALDRARVADFGKLVRPIMSNTSFACRLVNDVLLSCVVFIGTCDQRDRSVETSVNKRAL